MIIVLEGPDNAGKSTLAGILSDRMGLPIKHSGGPSRYSGEINERAKSFNEDTQSYIYDRHPCISQNLYVDALGNNGELVTQDNIDKFYSLKPLIIYCRSNGDLQGHQQSEHSSIEYFNQVENNYKKLCQVYDSWGLTKANIVYRIGDDIDSLIKLITNMEQLIANFHEKFNNEYHGSARELTTDLASFRVTCLKEEVSEYDEAVVNMDLHGQFDALIDLVYFAIGTSYIQGLPFTEGFLKVHSANMRKVRAQSAADSKRGSAYDVIKPEGWVAPDLNPIIEKTYEKKMD